MIVHNDHIKVGDKLRCCGPIHPGRLATVLTREGVAPSEQPYRILMVKEYGLGACRDIVQWGHLDVEVIDEQPTKLSDAKAALRRGVKPDITHVRTPLMNYVARNCEYGEDKYERSNFLRPTDNGKPAFERYRAYLRAAVAHTIKVLDAMERHQAMDPKLEDVKGMKKAAFAIDTDPDTTGKVGPSLLSHIGGAAASLNMALAQAVDAGLLPEDPGTPWRNK